MTEPANTDAPVKRGKATNKVADTLDAVENVSVVEVVAPKGNIISAPEVATGPRQSNLTPNDNGILGSRAADNALAKSPSAVKDKKQENKEAVWSDKNIRWAAVGSLAKGYNIVSKEAAEKWLTRDGIRKASPEEVAAHFGK